MKSGAAMEGEGEGEGEGDGDGDGGPRRRGGVEGGRDRLVFWFFLSLSLAPIYLS